MVLLRDFFALTYRDLIIINIRKYGKRICTQTKTTANATELEDKYGFCTKVHTCVKYITWLFLNSLSVSFSVAGISEIRTVAVLIILMVGN